MLRAHFSALQWVDIEILMQLQDVPDIKKALKQLLASSFKKEVETYTTPRLKKMSDDYQIAFKHILRFYYQLRVLDYATTLFRKPNPYYFNSHLNRAIQHFAQIGPTDFRSHAEINADLKNLKDSFQRFQKKSTQNEVMIILTFMLLMAMLSPMHSTKNFCFLLSLEPAEQERAYQELMERSPRDGLQFFFTGVILIFLLGAIVLSAMRSYLIKQTGKYSSQELNLKNELSCLEDSADPFCLSIKNEKVRQTLAQAEKAGSATQKRLFFTESNCQLEKKTQKILRQAEKVSPLGPIDDKFFSRLVENIAVKVKKKSR
jgi:hypothetical protein